MEFDNTALVQSLARLPPEPPKAPPKASIWAQIPRGVAAAGAEVFGQLQALDSRINDGMPDRRPADDPWRVEAERGQRRQIEIGRRADDFARELRPDAATAGTAEQVLFGLSKGLTKAVGSVVALGPMGGAAAFGGSEAATTYGDLTRDGVDPGTAGKAAAVVGVANTVGVALPMVGPTLKATAGLYLAGGPGGYLAQQAATQSVLRNAGYDQIAQKFDPLDPVGLSLSALIPLPFAAWGAARNIRASRAPAPVGAVDPPPAAEAAPPEAVDAAMVHNLTLLRGSQEARGQAIADDLARPVESLAQFAERTAFKPDAGPPMERGDFIAWLRDRGGVDIGQKLDITGEANGVRANPGGIFRRGGMPTDELAAMAADAGYLRPDQAGDSGALVDLVKRAVAGERVLNFDQQMRAAARADFETRTAQQMETMERRLRLLGVDPADARGNVEAMAAYLRENEDSLIAEASSRSAAARAADTLPDPPTRSGREQIEAVRTALQDMEDSGKTPDEFLQDVRLADDVRNLLIGMVEAGSNAKRADAMLADFERTAAAQPLRPTVDIAADVVEASRAGKAVTPEPEPIKAAAPEQAAADSFVSRLAQLEQEAPDLVVRTTEDGKAVTLADELAAARREAAEGSDVELGRLDADLVRVAAECALSLGG